MEEAAESPTDIVDSPAADIAAPKFHATHLQVLGSPGFKRDRWKQRPSSALPDMFRIALPLAHTLNYFVGDQIAQLILAIS
jgi:hypothetical protein